MNALLRLPAVLDRSGLKTSQFYEDIQSRRWTRGVKIGPRAVAWPSHEVDALIEARIAGWDAERISDLVRRLEAARSDAPRATAAMQQSAAA